MFELKFPYLFYHNKLASLQIELCIMRAMQRCKKQERERICERTETMSGKSSRINSNGIIILSSHIEQERPVRHVAVQGGWTAAGERWDWPALLAHNNIHQGSGIRMQVRTIGSGLGCAGCARGALGARDVAEVSSWVATWLLRCFSSWFRFKKKKKKTSKRICRATSGQVGSNSYPEHGLVKDGTPCGDNLICLNQTCVSLFPHVDQTKCPTNKQGQECSEHGVSFLSGAKQQRQLLQNTLCVCVYIYVYSHACMHTNIHSWCACFCAYKSPPFFSLFFFGVFPFCTVLHQRQPMLLRHGLGRAGLQRGGAADHATANGGIANAGEYN